MSASIPASTIGLLLLAFSSLASAQTCASPTPWQSDQAGSPPAIADLCAASDEVALYCDFLDSAGKLDVIWEVEFAEGYTSTSMAVSGAAAGFNPVIYLYSGPCSAGSGCLATGDQGSPMPLVGISPGTYFLAVSAAPSDAAGACGFVTLASNGWLPVALQQFWIE